MNNMQQIIRDPLLWAEFCKATNLAYPYKHWVQFKKDLILMPVNVILPEVIYNIPTREIMIDARTGFISSDLRSDKCYFCKQFMPVVSLDEIIDEKNESYLVCAKCKEVITNEFRMV